MAAAKPTLLYIWKKKQTVVRCTYIISEWKFCRWWRPEFCF